MSKTTVVTFRVPNEIHARWSASAAAKGQSVGAYALSRLLFWESPTKTEEKEVTPRFRQPQQKRGKPK
jgi:hypothetical protein